MTMSAYIVRKDSGEWRCLVHMHRKIELLMQIGGHIEHTQTPWQTFAQELRDETGYELDEVRVLQYALPPQQITDAVVHPVPFLVNTHNVGDEHFHSDLCYAVLAEGDAKGMVAEGEAQDIRWLTMDELWRAVDEGVAVRDTVEMYEYLLERIDDMIPVTLERYSLAKPAKGLRYKR